MVIPVRWGMAGVRGPTYGVTETEPTCTSVGPDVACQERARRCRNTIGVAGRAVVGPERRMTTTEERFQGPPLLETPDLGEAFRVTTDVFLPHHLHVLERSVPLQMKLNALHMGALTAGYLRYGPEVGMRTTQAGHYHVNIALTGAVRSRCGRRDEVDSARSQAAVFMPGDRAEILWGAG